MSVSVGARYSRSNFLRLTASGRPRVDRSAPLFLARACAPCRDSHLPTVLRRIVEDHLLQVPRQARRIRQARRVLERSRPWLAVRRGEGGDVGKVRLLERLSRDKSCGDLRGPERLVFWMKTKQTSARAEAARTQGQHSPGSTPPICVSHSVPQSVLTSPSLASGSTSR